MNRSSVSYLTWLAVNVVENGWTLNYTLTNPDTSTSSMCQIYSTQLDLVRRINELISMKYVEETPELVNPPEKLNEHDRQTEA